MLALISYRYVRWGLFAKEPKAAYDVVFGMRVIRLTLDITKKNEPTEKSKRALNRSNADMVCFCDDFPAKNYFDTAEPDMSEGIRLLMPKIYNTMSLGGETAYLSGGDDSVSAQMLYSLARDYRYVITTGLPETLLENVRLNTGASVLGDQHTKIKEAELAVLLKNPGHIVLSEDCIVLPVKRGYLKAVSCTRYVSIVNFDMAGEAPEGFSRKILISEALRRGAAHVSDIIVKEPEILTKYYN